MIMAVLLAPLRCSYFNPHLLLKAGATHNDTRKGIAKKFQSSPASSCGATLRRSCLSPSRLLRFNPHPLLQVGATYDNRQSLEVYQVSILTHPDELMQPVLVLYQYRHS